MKKRQIKQTISNSTNFPLDETKTSGVKDQNLFMDNATLSVKENVNIDNSLFIRNLAVTDTIISPCDVNIGGDLSTEKTDLHQTTISNGLNITSLTEKNQTPVFENLSDPLSQRDALTYAYYRKFSVQAYQNSIEYQSTYNINTGAVKLYGGSRAWRTYTSITPRCAQYFDVFDDRIIPKQAGIYQVTLQCTRWEGDHSGNDDANFLLFLISGSNRSLLSSTDTRGIWFSDRTTRVLHAIFPIPKLTTNQFYIQAQTTKHLKIKFFSTNVIWFPFNTNFSEVD
ncbi:hypothetical protein [Chlamydia sp. 17-3921]|uniref:hypothetical protein n=1 Tax=Chlamydia sp. 17-3921 TaxID=2675798 RepID=UPI00191897AB|nr:hypothetical protein [Chlamydia sp. 17-3921]